MPAFLDGNYSATKGCYIPTWGAALRCLDIVSSPYSTLSGLREAVYSNTGLHPVFKYGTPSGLMEKNPLCPELFILFRPAKCDMLNL